MVKLSAIKTALAACGGIEAAAHFLGLSRYQMRRAIVAQLPYGVTYKQFVEPDFMPDAAMHAKARASILWAAIAEFMTATDWPIVNPEAVVVDPQTEVRYSKKLGTITVDRPPRTWISGVLAAEPVPDVRDTVWVFTGAQNDTPVHKGFWANLQAYVAHRKAKLVVGGWTYETSWHNESGAAARSYAPEVYPHMCFGQMALGDDFLWMGDINILPTASKPLPDLISHSRGKWGIVPHATRALQVIPSTDPSRQPTQMMTSCSCTVPKVVPRKAGQKSVFNQVIGAIVVEFDGEGRVFCRQLSADEDGAFYDLSPTGIYRVTDGRIVDDGERPDSLVVADLHVAKLDPVNPAAVLGIDVRTGRHCNGMSMLTALNPRRVMIHDGFDNETRNHHHTKDGAYLYGLAVRGRDSVLDEVRGFARFVRQVSLTGVDVYVVESNHDLALEKYVSDPQRWWGDGVNHKLALQLATAQAEHAEETGAALDRYASPPKWSMLEHAARACEDMPGVTWLYDNTSFLVGGVEHAHHGFRGQGGAKSSHASYARLGVRITYGDKHTPSIMGGAYGVGAMALQMGYNKGIATWCVTHCVQYPDGKRTLVTMQDGKWCAALPKPRLPPLPKAAPEPQAAAIHPNRRRRGGLPSTRPSAS